MLNATRLMVVRILTAIVTLATLLSTPPSALAVPDYSAFARLQILSPPSTPEDPFGQARADQQIQRRDSSPVEVAISDVVQRGGNNIESLDASAAAGRGTLGVSTHVNSFFPDMADASVSRFGSSLTGTANAFAVFDDLIIPGSIGGRVMGSLNLHLEGGIGANSFRSVPAGAEGSSSAEASLVFFVRFPFSNEAFRGGLTASSANGGSPARGSNVSTNLNGSDVQAELASFSGDAVLTFPSVILPVGEAFTLRIDMEAIAQARARCGAFGVGCAGSLETFNLQAEGEASFLNTLSFPLSSAVFNLPDGFTINSLSGLIVNNQWVGAPTGAVPEPGSLALLGAGIAGLAGMGWRRRRSA